LASPVPWALSPGPGRESVRRSGRRTGSSRAER
jgi:hypothetical protein